MADLPPGLVPFRVPDHLVSFDHTYQVLSKNVCYTIPTRVYFSNHCYTREFEAGDSEGLVVWQESVRGQQVRRCLDAGRWEKSLALPALVRSLADKHCYVGQQNGLWIHMHSKPPNQPHAGWFLFVNVSIKRAHQRLDLDVRSHHFRTNMPMNARNQPKRFRIVLLEAYKKLTNEKAPQ